MKNKSISLADMKPTPDPLDRIADTLEDINQSLQQLNDTLGCVSLHLSDMTELTECIGNTPRGKLFCISGNVTTYEG